NAMVHEAPDFGVSHSGRTSRHLLGVGTAQSRGGGAGSHALPVVAAARFGLTQELFAVRATEQALRFDLAVALEAPALHGEGPPSVGADPRTSLSSVCSETVCTNAVPSALRSSPALPLEERVFRPHRLGCQPPRCRRCIRQPPISGSTCAVPLRMRSGAA